MLETISASASDFEFKLSYHDIGGKAVDTVGQNLPDSTLKACKEADAIILGKYIVQSTPRLSKPVYQVLSEDQNGLRAQCALKWAC